MYEETETWRTNCIYHSHKRIRIRLCQWEDISGESEICLRTRIKLLLLSGCGCILPHRGAAGAFKPEGISDSVCGSGIFLSVWKSVRAFCLRMAVSLWTGAGSFIQNSCFSQKENPSISPCFEVWKICCVISSGGRRISVSLWGICKGSRIL